ncbi:MAG: [protein-PII] uridylyltransferase [Acidimicrobiia bacterium]
MVNLGPERQALLADPALAGGDLCRAYSGLVDSWLAGLFARAVGDDPSGVALVATGGYGRGELSPRSDIDLLLLHGGRRDVGTVADAIWYPIWDEGLKLGHSVRTTKEALVLASDDLDTATSLLDVRHLAGDPALTAELAERAARQWRNRAKRWLAQLSRRVAERHARAGEVAFLLEPDLKEGRGGLRDVHALRWAGAARTLLWEGDQSALDEAYALLLAVRVELHRRTGRPGDRLVLEEQDAVAAALGRPSADDLMAEVAAAARTIAWRSDDAWRRIDASLAGPLGRLSRRDRPVGDGLVVRDDEVHLTGAADLSDPALALRAAGAAARAGIGVHRDGLARLAAADPPVPDPWPEGLRAAFVDLLLAGPPAIGAVEALDQLGLWVRLLPEWRPVRSKPQRNAYHRFTVDRHLVETAANAAGLAGSVRRPDLLVVGALLHDIGKGYPGDHTEVGMEMVASMGPRMGFPDADVSQLVAMVRHHLLLPDVATRRDLDDPATATAVAEAVGDPLTLELLAALTEADSLATGPAAWGTWKAGLVRELVTRTAHVLAGGAVEDLAAEFPTPDQRVLLQARRQVVEGLHDQLTVVAEDRQGLFSRVAGTLALHGLDVLAANIATVEGMALEVFRVESSFGPTIEWDRVVADVERALSGRLALHARLAERARTYRVRPVPQVRPIRPEVRIDNDASADATVVEVHAADGLGVLYRITRALADLDLDVTFARVQTMGPTVVDAFYVRDPAAGKIADPALLAEIERALLHELAGPQGPERA